IFSAGRVRLEMSSYFGHCYRDSDGGRRPRHPPKSAAPSHNSRGPRRRAPRRRLMVGHLDLVRSRDGADGAPDVVPDGPRPTLLLSAATLFAGGLWQVTRTKEICLSHCTSPTGFVLQYWRSGRIGAMRMGFRHSLYCIGCCWLFMLVLFISGSMSLLWMGG